MGMCWNLYGQNESRLQSCAAHEGFDNWGGKRQTQQVCYRHSGSRGKAGLGSVRPGKEPGVRLKLLDREKYPSQSRLADEAGEAVAEGAVVVEEVRAPFAPQGKERVRTCL